MRKTWTKKKVEEITTPKEKKETPPPPKAEMKEPAPIQGVGNVWYDAASGKYFRENAEKRWIDYKESDFKRYLKYCNYSTKVGEHSTISVLDRLMVEIHQHRRVDFAGEIAGYKAGKWNILGSKIIVPKGNQLPTPQKGNWPTIKTTVNQLLGMQQRLFYAWMKSAYESLAAGPPWRPGQMLAIAGESGCGKSLLQNLITQMLGGRAAKPYSFLCGDSNFNSPYIGAEHWMIEDEASSTDIRTRRYFGAQIKNTIVNEVHDCKPKGKDCFPVTPFVRLTMTLNDNPESMMVLPPLDEDVADKIILLKASKIIPPFEQDDLAGRAKFWNRLVGEIPAFLHAMERTKIPADLFDNRYGVKAWHHPALASSLNSLAPEARLLGLIDSVGFFDDFRTRFEGTSLEFEKQLRLADKGGDISRLLTYSSACGIFLARLAAKQKDRVRILKEKKGQNIYLILGEGVKE